MDAEVHDITAPICVRGGEVRIPRPRALEFTVRQVGHDLILGRGKPVKYLSNIITLNTHMATHYDLPSTFGYDNLPAHKLEPSIFVRRAVILNAPTHPHRVKPLRKKDVHLPRSLESEYNAPPHERPALIIRTGMYRYWCRDDERYMRFPGLSRELVEWIAEELGPPIVGIDAISVDRTMEYRTTNMYPYIEKDFIQQVRGQENLALLNHDALFKKGILILENLHLETVPPSLRSGLLIAPPIFRFDCKADCSIHAIPARPLLVEPPPSSEEVIQSLRELRRMIS